MARNVAAYRAEGYSRFQFKVGFGADADIERIRAVSKMLRAGNRLVAVTTARPPTKLYESSAPYAISMYISSSPASPTRSASVCAATATIPSCWMK